MIKTRIIHTGKHLWKVVAMLFLAFCISLYFAPQTSAQTKNKKTVTKTATTKKSTSSSKKSSTTTKKSSSTKKTSKTKTVLSESKKLQNEQAATKRLRAIQQQKEKQLNHSIKSNLDSVILISNEIVTQQHIVDSLNRSIKIVEARIDLLNTEIEKLKKDLKDKKDKYANSIKYQQRNRSAQDELMFIFSANKFSQMLRRLRYAREYSSYQVVQGKLIRAQQHKTMIKQNDLLKMKTQLFFDKIEKKERQEALKKMRTNCEEKIVYLNKNLERVQSQIQVYKEKEADLDKQIEAAIQKEIEAARKAEAERKAREEAARKAAEAERREKERQLAEAKEAKARAEAAKKAAAERIALAQKAKEEATNSVEKKDAKKEISNLKSEIKAAEKDMKKADADIKKADEAVRLAAQNESVKMAEIDKWVANDNNAKLSSSFTANKGHLPMPITGSYVIAKHYGTYTVPGLKAVTLDNKGIDIKGHDGAMARAVFDGEVSSVFQYGSSYIVMLRHGSYISVYSGLSSVAVSKGQTVTTRQSLGRVGRNSDGNIILHFQLRKESARLNPEQWVR
ncbi:MAG: peptidoglycan DD-metalloendopeptidase family protein [Prevotellaceae bacterium]|nr:peptidoglycan DD-metalloendopeptidase family protein [Candidatus Colivivens equi]